MLSMPVLPVIPFLFKLGLRLCFVSKETAMQQPQEPLEPPDAPVPAPYQPERTEGTEWPRVRSFSMNTLALTNL
jgi:hypothetical protein